MELGQYQLHIFVSLIILIGTAFLALICDFLRRNNHDMRELTVELKARREQEQKRAQWLAARGVPADGLLKRDALSKKRNALPKKEAAPAKIIDASLEPPPTRALPAPPPLLRRNRNRETRVLRRDEVLARTERAAILAPKAETPSPLLMPPISPTAEVKQQEKVIVTIGPSSNTPAPNTPDALGAVPVRRDWAAILDRAKQVEPLQQPSVPIEPTLPTGLRDSDVLSQLMRARRQVSGLVVSVGVHSESTRADGSLRGSTRRLVESLLGPGDLAAQCSPEEFVLIYPQERGAAAQRKLSQIAQQLWDFQLHSLGSSELLFSWGGFEAKGEMIEDAISSASERMRESRRAHRHQSSLRQAV